jgi:hypothetical protein
MMENCLHCYEGHTPREILDMERRRFILSLFFFAFPSLLASWQSPDAFESARDLSLILFEKADMDEFNSFIHALLCCLKNFVENSVVSLKPDEINRCRENQSCYYMGKFLVVPQCGTCP